MLSLYNDYNYFHIYVEEMNYLKGKLPMKVIIQYLSKIEHFQNVTGVTSLVLHFVPCFKNVNKYQMEQHKSFQS